MRKLLLLSFYCITVTANAQSLSQSLQTAYHKLEQDSQSQYASMSITVLDAKTGEQIFTANPNMGLATASTLKTVTTITAFNVLGKDFQYQTTLNSNGTVDAGGILNGDLIIKGSGDPTLGSWRYAATKENNVLTIWVDAIRKAGIKKINGHIIGDDSLFGTQAIPDGWIFQDMGTYYGVGTSGLCWRENQFDIKLKTGEVGSKVQVVKAVPQMPYLSFSSEATTGKAGTGDNTYPYLPVNNNVMYLRGTYAVDKDKKSISAALPDAAYDAAFRLMDTLKRLGITITGAPESMATLQVAHQDMPVGDKVISTINSPALSQIVHWTNLKSINLYAEQLLKTMAYKAGKIPTTVNGTEFMLQFWKQKGIDPHSMAITDGSGLSPEDRVTTQTIARILQSATQESWFPDFYESLPTYNNMKMKSGSIMNVLAYAGYQTTKNGREVCFSIIINNYNGGTAGIKQKMYDVLDVLK